MTRAIGPSHIEGSVSHDISSVHQEIEAAKVQLASAEARIAFLGESNHRIAREKYNKALRIYRELGGMSRWLRPCLGSAMFLE